MLCQFWPQFRDMACHVLLPEPLMDTDTTSPAPATLVMRTRLKYEWPLIVNLIPPLFLQETLKRVIKHGHCLVYIFTKYTR